MPPKKSTQLGSPLPNSTVWIILAVVAIVIAVILFAVSKQSSVVQPGITKNTSTVTPPAQNNTPTIPKPLEPTPTQPTTQEPRTLPTSPTTKPTPTTMGVFGKVVSTTKNSITIKMVAPTGQEGDTFTATTTNDTKFTHQTLTAPGTFTAKPGSISEIKTGWFVSATSANDIGNSKTFTAVEVNYSKDSPY